MRRENAKSNQTPSSASSSTPCFLSSVDAEKRRRNTARNKKWRMENPDKVAAAKVRNKERMRLKAKTDPMVYEKVREWKKKNPEKVRKARNAWAKNNRKQERARAAGWREDLTDRYVKDILVKRTSLKTSDIPQELVELKRKQLKTHRKLKEIENEK